MQYEHVKPKYRSSWFSPAQALVYYLRRYKVREIQIHWWNSNTIKGQTHDGTVEYIRKKFGGSVNYVASAGRVTRMVDEKNCALTTQGGNPHGIKIECSPYGTNGDYKTIGALVADIRTRYGDIPLVPHYRYLKTECPGILDLARIDREARKGNIKPSKPQGEEMVTKSQLETKFKTMLHRMPDPGAYKTYVGRIHSFVDTAISGSAEFKSHQAYLKNVTKQVQALQVALRNEKNKPPKTVTKTVEKIVEKIVKVKVPVEKIVEIEKPLSWKRVVEWIIEQFNKLRRK